MEPVRRAVIDVGTNSVKLLVAEVAGGEVKPVCEHSHQTRLGRGFYAGRRLHPEAIAATVKAMNRLMAMARYAGAGSVRVIATSAVREAVNREELTGAIERAVGLKVQVISGEQEAEWGYRGVITDAALAEAALLMLDVGGGSTQCIFGRGGQAQLCFSFPLGTVRLMETLACSDPPKAAELAGCRQWLKEFVQREMRPKLVLESGGGVQLVGGGGTASILGCMEAGLVAFDRARIEATRLSAGRVRWHVERLWGLPLEARKKIIGLPKNRADVILMGVAIYEAVMEGFGFGELRISTRGLRFAAVLDSRASDMGPDSSSC